MVLNGTGVQVMAFLLELRMRLLRAPLFSTTSISGIFCILSESARIEPWTLGKTMVTSIYYSFSPALLVESNTHLFTTRCSISACVPFS